MLKQKAEANEGLGPIDLNMVLLYFQLVAGLHYHLLREASITMPRQRMPFYSRPCRPNFNHELFVFLSKLFIPILFNLIFPIWKDASTNPLRKITTN
jgi:hypothetical protein